MFSILTENVEDWDLEESQGVRIQADERFYSFPGKLRDLDQLGSCNKHEQAEIRAAQSSTATQGSKYSSC